MPGTWWDACLFPKPALELGSASDGQPPGFVNKVLLAHRHSHLSAVVHSGFCTGATELGSCDIDPVAHNPETSTLWLFIDHSPAPLCVILHGRAGKPARAAAHLPRGLRELPRGLCGLGEGASCQSLACPGGVLGRETGPGWALTPLSPVPQTLGAA